MAVDRKLLKQALEDAQSIQTRAITGEDILMTGGATW